MYSTFNNAVKKSLCSDELEYEDIKRIYKKESGNEKRNYRSLKVLPNLRKVFEY